MDLTHRKWSHPASHDTRELQSRHLQTLATETTCLGATSCLSGPSPTSGRFHKRIEVELHRSGPRPCSCLPRSSECLFSHTSEIACEHFLSLLFLLSSLTRGRFDSSLSLCLSLCLSVSLCLSLSLSLSVSHQGCPLSACGFSAVVDPVLRSVMAQLCTHYDSSAKLFAYLDDWYLWIKPQFLLQTIAVITAATRSVNLALQSTKTQVWKGSCQDPTPPEFQDKVTLTLSCLGGHLQIHGDAEPSPVVLGEQATMEKTTQRFLKIATTLADLDAEGLNVQTVNDLLTMYVGAANQHVLRMSFVPEQEAQNFDRQVITCWSRLMHRDIASPLFFCLSRLVGLEWDLQFNVMLLPHGVRDSRSFPQ